MDFPHKKVCNDVTKDVHRRFLGLYRAMTEKIVELNEGRGMTDALMARLELAHELTAQQGFCGELWEISEESPPQQDIVLAPGGKYW